MARRNYRIWNAATAALTAAPTLVTTGTTIKTMLQLKPTIHTAIYAWGFRFDVAPTAIVKVELLTTGVINATVTASAAGDILKYSDPSDPTSTLTLATSGTGYTSSGEGTITTTRLLDFRNCAVGGETSYDIQFPLDREPACGPSDYLRIRATTATAINMLCYVDIEE